MPAVEGGARDLDPYIGAAAVGEVKKRDENWTKTSLRTPMIRRWIV